MAEGLLRSRYGDLYESFSAGTAPGQVNPFAVEAMREISIDISGHESEHVDAYISQPLAYVVTVCDSAREACPYIPATKQNIHVSFPDPSAVVGSDEEKLSAFRAARNGIADWIDTTFGPPART